jgi:hypothetical protein
MRSIILSLVIAIPLSAAELVVHEWGTFTSVSGSDGILLTGLEVEEERLPNFVRSHVGFAPFDKGWSRPVAGVTIKMETPVLYFYSAAPVAVRVDVGFRGGSISQWYPERSGGEWVAPAPRDEAQRRALPPIDFARGYTGAATWQIDVLPRDPLPAISAPRAWETPQWGRARVPDANRIRGAKGEVEGFIFYRGIGNFALPLEVRAAADGKLTLRNSGASPIANAFVYDRRGAADVRWLQTGPLPAGGTRSMPLPGRGTTAIDGALRSALVDAGLTGAEAKALLATWHESYFERAGLRVFWIVPREFTDAILPIAITPAPAKLVRVLVGRAEVLAPAFEAELARDFVSDGGKRWEQDRYFRAYRERAAGLRNIVGVARTVAGP